MAVTMGTIRRTGSNRSGARTRLADAPRQRRNPGPTGGYAILRFADHLMPQIVDADLSQDFTKHQMIFDDDNPHDERWYGIGCERRDNGGDPLVCSNLVHTWGVPPVENTGV